MHKLYIRPGAVVSPNAITIPADEPRIVQVVSAEIWRFATAIVPDDHDSTLLDPAVDQTNHTQAEVVGAMAEHAVHGHDITTVVAAGAGQAVTEPAAAGVFESAGAGQVNPGVVDVNAAAQAHAVGVNPVVNAFGAGAVLPHTYVTPTILVAVTPTIVAASNSQFTLNVTTRIDDLLILNYEAEGERAYPS